MKLLVWPILIIQRQSVGAEGVFRRGARRISNYRDVQARIKIGYAVVVAMWHVIVLSSRFGRFDSSNKITTLPGPCAVVVSRDCHG